MKMRTMLTAAMCALGVSSAAQAAVIDLTTSIHGQIRDLAASGPVDGVPEDIRTDRIGLAHFQDADSGANLFPSRDVRGLIEFDISALAGGVSSAELILTTAPVSSAFIAAHTVNLFGYSGDGSITLSDFSAGSLITDFAYFNEPSVTLDVTAFIENQILLGGSFAGFNLFLLDPTNIGGPAQFASFGRQNVSPFPVLRITEAAAVPTPPALPLLALSLLFLGWVRRRS